MAIYSPTSRRRRRRLSAEPLEPRIVLDSTVVFSEIMYNPPGTDESLEWVELHNQMAVNVDISGWRLDDAIEYTFPEGTVIEGGEYLVVAANPDALAAASGLTEIFGPYSGNLSDGGERIQLLNHTDRRMNEVEYDDDGDWSILADGSGASLAKTTSQSASHLVENWTASEQIGGTPGAENFVVEVIERVSLEPISLGDTASVFVPTDASLANTWNSADYIEGSSGETWINGPSAIGFDATPEMITYEDAVVADNPLAYWRFGESNNNQTSTNLGTLGAVADGDYSSSADLTADSLVNDPTDGALKLGLTRFPTSMITDGFEKLDNGTGRTIEFWFALDTAPSVDASLVGDGDDTSDFSHMVYITRDSTIETFLQTADSVSQVESERVIEPGEVVHVVSTWDAATGQISLFLDGQQAAITTSVGTNPTTGAPVNTANPIFVGGDDRTLLSVNARVDEVAIYNKPLTETMAASHFVAGQPTLGAQVATNIEAVLYQQNTSAYIRQPFDLPANIDFDQMQLDIRYDDGFVAYLNGAEVARRNAPPSVQFNSAAIADRGLVESLSTETINLREHVDALRAGQNLLAIQGLNSSANNADFLISPELNVSGNTIPAAPRPSISINEVASALDESFQVELRNDGRTTIDLAGYILAVDGATPSEYVIPTTRTISAGGYVAFDEATLGFEPVSGDRLSLFQPNKTGLLDAQEVTDRLRGRSPEHDGRWLYPDVATFGTTNQFDFETDIVINEIMYNARPTYATPAVIEPTIIIDFDHSWRYDQSGNDQGTAWRAPDFDDSSWPEAEGLFFVESSDLPGPKTTPLTLGLPTYYFRTTFDIADPTTADVVLEHLVDDGAVFYVNGIEVSRFNLPAGPITYDTLASSAVGNATVSAALSVPNHLLVAGPNSLAVEVHQQFTFSPDVVFGARLSTQATIVPATEFSQSSEEWIELYNRGTETVDLTGWDLSDGVQFEFEPGTLLAPGEFAVVANDPNQLAALHPGINIVGAFSGRLTNSGERIQLHDAGGNMADEVRFFKGGRWPRFADGGGSSLELRDPHADNATGEAWSSSDEAERSQWQHVSYRAIADPIPHDPRPMAFHEFVMGLLAAGEVWIDNISVIEDPDGAAIELIQNGNFEGDVPDGQAGKWRIQGTHEDSHVIADPADPGNNVLRLIAEARMNYLGNHAETTLANGAEVINGTEYEISFDAKWISGSPQLHTELYYEDAARTTILSQPTVSGTPGATNSTWVANLGPTYQQLSHFPVVPSSNEHVTIRVEPSDPDGLANVTLFYSVDDEAFTSLEMATSADGSYSVQLPPQANNRRVQFYVRGTDNLGATTMFPAAGPDSRAMYKVDDTYVPDPLRHDFQIIMTPAEANALHVNTNMLDNDRTGSTVIYNGNEVFYNVGTRLRGSMFSRNNRAGTGYNVRFNPDQLFRGVHESIGFDQGGEREILAKFISLQTGHLGGTYDDVFRLETPSGSGGGPTLVYLARHQDIFLGEQFESGADGMLFKFEGIRVMTNTVDGQPESLKIYQPIGWMGGFDIQNLGNDKEKYRWPFLINNNRKKDDYSRLIDMAQAFDAPLDTLQEKVAAVMDVDNLTHTFALMSLLGIGDAYSQGNPHNLNIYVRPGDSKVLTFPWDWDFTFNQSASAPLHGNKNIGRILDQPHFEHFLLGHMQHMIQTKFNRTYMDPWTEHFGSMLSENYNQYRSNIQNRGNFVNGQLPANVPFEITQSTALPTSVSLTGRGWVNVKEIRLSPSSDPIDVEWTSSTSWAATLPLDPGANELTLMAYDFGGELVGSEDITVASTTPRPLHDFLRLSEIMYHPAAPTASEFEAGFDDDDAFEFVELINTSSGAQAQTLDLGGVSVSAGVAYTFPSNTQLEAGERILIVNDLIGFRQRYGPDPNVAGEFDGQLSNGGERIEISDSVGATIVSVEYDDSNLWPEAADGLGASLEIIDAATSAELANKYYQWRASTESGGSPGTAGTAPVGIVISEILAHTDPPVAQSDSVELFNSGTEVVDISGWFLSDSGDSLLKFEIPAGTLLGPSEYIVFDEGHFNPTPLTPGPNDFALSGTNGDDVWLVDPTGGKLRFIDEVHFGATFNGQSLGLTNNSNGRLVPLTRNGFGCGEGHALVSDAHIEVINYLPAAPSAAALAIDPTLDNNDLEYIVVRGPVGEGWRLRGGVNFDFPAGFSTAPTVWLLSFDPASPVNADKLAAFKAHYEITGDSPSLVGGYSGSLNNAGERIRLESPDEPPMEDPNNTPYVTVDEVIYDNQGNWPTPVPGDPIVRRASTYFGGDGSLWVRASELPQANNVPGDFNGDVQVDARDIDLLIDAVNRDSVNGDYVLSGTLPTPELQEVDYFVEVFLGTFFGDANLDLSVGAEDLNRIGVNWLSKGCRGWRDGDFNGDGIVNAADLNALGVNWLRANAAAARAPLNRSAVDVPTVNATGSNIRGESERDSIFRQFHSQDESSSSRAASLGRRVRVNSASGRRRTRLLPSAESISGQAFNSVDKLFAELSEFSTR